MRAAVKLPDKRFAALCIVAVVIAAIASATIAEVSRNNALYSSKGAKEQRMKVQLTWYHYGSDAISWRLDNKTISMVSKLYKNEVAARKGLAAVLKQLRTEGVEVIQRQERFCSDE